MFPTQNSSLKNLLADHRERTSQNFMRSQNSLANVRQGTSAALNRYIPSYNGNGNGNSNSNVQQFSNRSYNNEYSQNQANFYPNQNSCNVMTQNRIETSMPINFNSDQYNHNTTQIQPEDKIDIILNEKSQRIEKDQNEINMGRIKSDLKEIKVYMDSKAQEVSNLVDNIISRNQKENQIFRLTTEKKMMNIEKQISLFTTGLNELQNEFEFPMPSKLLSKR